MQIDWRDEIKCSAKMLLWSLFSLLLSWQYDDNHYMKSIKIKTD